MPELPEAETIARGLRVPLRGRRIARVEIRHADLLEGSSPRAFRRTLDGRALGKVGRRGKNVAIQLVGDAGAGHEVEAHGDTTHAAAAGTAVGPFTLVVNLGMSGRLLHRAAGTEEPPPSHPGVRFHLDDGGELVYHDPRRFGRLRLLDGDAFRSWSGTLGPEPLGSDFTPKRLQEGLSRTASPLRSWLLDQRKVAGIGNIYANEALFVAGLHPETRGQDAPPSRVAALHGAIRTVLREAIRARGTTLRDYRTAQGWEGSYAVRLRVYGREGLPCPTCGSAVRRTVFGGRSAFFCPDCQRPML